MEVDGEEADVFPFVSLVVSSLSYFFDWTSWCFFLGGGGYHRFNAYRDTGFPLLRPYLKDP